MILLMMFMSFFSSTFSADMSIIDYDLVHGLSVSKPNKTDAEVERLFEAWLVKHGKNYNALGEKEKRFAIFKENLKFIEEHNSVDRTYRVGLNKFADLSNDEYRSMYLGVRMDRKKSRVAAAMNSERYLFNDGEKLPESVDWREKGAVVNVKDQGQCGE